MNKTAIIDYNTDFSAYYEFLFKAGIFKREKFIKNYYEENKKIIVYNIPLLPSSLFKKNNYVFLNKFLKILKNDGIKNIILSDKAKKIDFLNDFLSKEFYIFDGKKVIIDEISYIIKKYIENDEKNEIIFHSDSFNDFYKCFISLFKNYRISTIITKNKNDFFKFKEEVYETLGININLLDNDENIDYKNKIAIKTSTEKTENYDIDIKNSSVYFFTDKKYRFLYEYFKNIDQRVLEYIFYIVKEDEKNIKINQFLKEEKIRIVKFIKKD